MNVGFQRGTSQKFMCFVTSVSSAYTRGKLQVLKRNSKKKWLSSDQLHNNFMALHLNVPVYANIVNPYVWIV